MKSLILVSVLLLCGAAISDAQQFPISVSGMYGPNYPSNQYNIVFPQMQGAHINWGNANVDGLSLATVENLLSNTPSGISLILENVLPDYGWAEKLYFEAGKNNMYFATVHGNLVSDGQSEQPSNDPLYYDGNELDATLADAYMVEGAKYDPVDPWVAGASYQAYFRLKVQRSGSINATQPIASIEVWDTQNTPNIEIASRVLYDTSFANDNTYYTFTLGFTPTSHNNPAALASAATPTSATQPQYVPSESRYAATEPSYPDQIDVRVWWYGNPAGATVNLFLDDIRVESTDGKTDFSTDSLFSGYYNSGIKVLADTLDKYSALGRYYLKDEPYTSQYLSYQYLNTVLDSAGASHASGKGLGYTQKDEGLHLHLHNWVGDPWRRFLTEGQPHELAAEVDKFYSNDQQPGTAGYTAMAQGELQNEMDKFDSAEADRYLTPDATWRAHINSSSWHGTYREPHVSEITAQIWCAFAHGAKGINYFDYLSNTMYTDTGLVDPSSSLTPINQGDSWEAYPSENKFNSIAALDSEIATSIGPLLMQSGFTWQAAYSDTGQQNGYYGPYITSISTNPYDADTTYVEIGEFTDVSGNRYFMLVNRRTSPWDTRNITVNFSLGSGSWDISDVSSGNSWVIQQSGYLTDSFTAGQGKLYKVVPANYSSTRTIPAGATMTISAGTTLSFGSGAALSVNGALSAIGNPASHITFTNTSGTWGGIQFNNTMSSSNTVQYATIQNATYGIYENNSDVYVANCTIQNNSTGVYCYASSDSIFNNSFQSNSGCGIYASNVTSAAYYRGNTFNNDESTMFLNNAQPSYGFNRASDLASGITVNSSSHPNIWTLPQEGYDMRGYNVINCGGEPNVWCENYSNAYMGYDYDGGYNTVCESNLPYLEASNHSIIDADNNYWGGGPANLADGTSSILTRTPLSSDPNHAGCSSSTVKASPNIQSVAQRATGGPITDDGAGVTPLSDTSQTAADFWQAVSVGEKGSYSEARSALQTIINGSYDDKYSPLALLYFDSFSDHFRPAGSSTDSSEYNGLISMLKGVAGRAAGDSLKPFAIRLLAREAALRKDFISANNYNTYVVNNYPNSTNQLTALYDLMEYNLVVANDAEKAQQYLSDMISAYPNDSLTAMAKFLLGQRSSLKQARQQSEPLTVDKNQPASFSLEQAYPNPFNPTTVIAYRLPKDTHVTIKVYDILGRNVATLVDGEETAGYHEVTFDGSRVASGVYFYRLATPTYSVVRKMILMK